MLDHDVCYRALTTRDHRFDGRIFVGVTSTGIFCRPVCPARTAKSENCRFFPSAEAAQNAGFRPCLRCRPETVLHLGSWRGTSNTVARGLALIAEGELDGDDANVDALAERLGVGARQLRRLFDQHLGASPIAVAQSRRVLFAKQLIHETQLSMAEIAIASGFGSVRRFNEVFRALYQRPPSTLRRTTAKPSQPGVTVKLRYRPPYDWPAMLSHLEDRAIDGVERVEGETYIRTIAYDGKSGTVEISHAPAASALVATIHFPDVLALRTIVDRLRRLFDLAADVGAIEAHLAQDPLLAPMVAARPGLRPVGAWDGFELAVRAILGQQITVAAARTLATKLVRACGTKLPSGQGFTFPTAPQVLAADLASTSVLAMPKARRDALKALARAAVDEPRLFEPLEAVDRTVARLLAIKGVGEWTANYIALRAAREPDAFPASDVGLLRGAGANGTRPSPADLLARAERWRPWRAYAAQHLWAAAAASTS